MTVQLPTGHIAKEISTEEKEDLTRNFEGYAKFYDANEYLMRAIPGGWLLPSTFIAISDQIYNFKFKNADVIVMSHPKSGTNWSCETVWTMLHNRNLNNPEALASINIKRAFFLEYDAYFIHEDHTIGSPILDIFRTLCPGKSEEDGAMLQIIDSLQERRVIKTHLPFSLFNRNLIQTCKVIYVMRNPKDVVVSYMHHSRLYHLFGYVGNFDQFFEYFLDDKLLFGPFWSHVKDAWALKDHPNMLFLFYEDLKKNTKDEYMKINTFLQADLSPSEIDKIIEYTSFAAMKKREDGYKGELYNHEVIKTDGSFFRKGESGSWKNKLTPEQETKIESWIKVNTEGM